MVLDTDDHGDDDNDDGGEEGGVSGGWKWTLLPKLRTPLRNGTIRDCRPVFESRINSKSTFLVESPWVEYSLNLFSIH